MGQNTGGEAEATWRMGWKQILQLVERRGRDTLHKSLQRNQLEGEDEGPVTHAVRGSRLSPLTIKRDSNPKHSTRERPGV